MTDVIINVVSGMIGGLIFGIAGYLAAIKEGEEFEPITFLKGVFPGIVTGLVVGVTSPDWITALLAGISGGTLSNTVSKLISSDEIIN